MTQTETKTSERRDRTRQMIQSLMDARRQTLDHYAELAGHSASGAGSTQDTLRNFCQSLIDYTASTHFQLYQYLDSKTERRKAVLDIANEIYPGIVGLTTDIVDFNDKYDCDDDLENLTALADDLRRLRTALDRRINLEDRLIEALMR
jgi:regulator of sigma D